MENPTGFVSFEEALGLVGTGRFQWLMLLMCGIANAADATEIMSIGLVATGAESFFNLTPTRQGALNACVFAGMFLGGITWGLLGDKLGRRKALLLALLINAFFGTLSAASQSLWQLVVLRLMAGLGVGGSMPVVFAMLSELCPAVTRGKFLALLASFWMVGSVYSATFGWIIIPTAGWRLFVVMASVPAWAACISMWLYMPESPRYFMVMGNYKEAVEVLSHAASVNGRSLPAGLRLIPVDQSDQSVLDGKYHDVLPSHGFAGKARSSWHHIRNAAQRAWGVYQTLFRRPLRSYTLPLAVGWIGLCGGWYCTVLWVPRYFEERGAKGSSIYAQTFFVSLANLPGNIASVFLVDCIGRRWTACACMAGACVCALGFALAPARGIWPTLAACVFNAVSVGGWNSLDMISSELYPTTVRASGFGLLNAIGRVSSFVTTYGAGALLEVALWAPLVVAAVLLALGSLAMMMLPEPAGQPLEDTLQECEQHQHHALGHDSMSENSDSLRCSQGGGDGEGALLLSKITKGARNVNTDESRQLLG